MEARKRRSISNYQSSDLRHPTQLEHIGENYVLQSPLQAQTAIVLGKTEDAKTRQQGEEEVVNVPDLVK